MPFFDQVEGNKYSQSFRLMEWNKTVPGMISVEQSFDYFGGLLMGDFPFWSQYVYRSDVQDTKIQLSTNFTSNFKIELAEMFKYDFEIEFVPFILTLGIDWYSTAFMQETCAMIYYNYDLL